MTPAISLPAESTRAGFDVWEVHGSPLEGGPWRKANAGESGKPVQARFNENESFWRIVWVNHTGAVSIGPAEPLPWASASVPSTRRIPGRDF